MKIRHISLVLVFALSSCAKYMDDEHPGADSAAIRDSAVMETIKTMSKEKLSGVWVRPIKTEPGDEGFNLKADGSLAFVNMYSMSGDKWELRGDSLILFSHTERYPDPRPHGYKIAEISDSTITLIPQNAEAGYKEVYKRKDFKLPERFSEFYKKEFHGLIKPVQAIDHTFEVKTIFDGEIKLVTNDKNIRFIILKDENEITEPITEWSGGFPPGKYSIKVFIATGGMHKGNESEYTITIKED
jgi:hypothetical protein